MQKVYSMLRDKDQATKSAGIEITSQRRRQDVELSKALAPVAPDDCWLTSTTVEPDICFWGLLQLLAAIRAMEGSSRNV
jgi:Tfp pilus assembly protein PilN